MNNLALLPMENYGFWQACRTNEVFKAISIYSPYCFIYESDLFDINSHVLTIPDILDYEQLLDVVDITKHPYELANTPTGNQVYDTTAQMRLLWFKHHHRGQVSQTRNRIRVQFKSELNRNQELELTRNIKLLANASNIMRKSQ